MPTRRAFFALGAASVALLAAGSPARAQAAEATAFIQQLGSQLVAVVNGPGTVAAKRARVEPLIEQAVDVEAIGRFCLGRFWRVSTPQQQQEFLRLFRQVLMSNIAGRLGDQGIGFTLTNTVERDGTASVGTVIRRPNQQPAQVQWVVSTQSGRPKIIDVIAEGTSLRLTQRSDYAAYITRNGNNVDALLQAMRQQVAA